ncbi:glycoside hydrolase family 2 protein [Haloferula sp. A504]|uniref:glycoside hydrolase family 2 protein n=1 Tax=Haloferula sp. A504 TaxID=3373601 RepID=UPI0031C1BE1D|nr:glycoside hydrolase family 2 [Verrucomicrobiaceae bacterium E54]
MNLHTISIAILAASCAPLAAAEKAYGSLMTRWGKQVTPENAWREYPRPQLVRDQWLNLNGMWDYAVTAIDAGRPAGWDGRILVPFCLESQLSGVQRNLAPNEALWYHRKFKLDAKDPDKRHHLNFEGVDYASTIWVNGREAGSHRGGTNPFSLEVTDMLEPGENEIVVKVTDATGGWQLVGKQTLKPKGIRYTRVSGIWQTVWLETTPRTFISNLAIDTKVSPAEVRIEAAVTGNGFNRIKVELEADGRTLAAESAAGSRTVTLPVPDAKLWSPRSPHLYDLAVTLLDRDGKEVDRVKSYCGIREVGKQRDPDGHLRFTLNGKAIFHLGPLDQGWWPDGLWTPPSDAALRYDIEFLKQAGFNTIRKHVKREPRRFYYHCDHIGMLVWQDQPAGGTSPKWVRPNHKAPEDAEWPDEHHAQWMAEYESMIDDLHSHPSVVVWVPFNESWGQHRTIEIGKWTMRRDPGRLLNIASGGNFFPVGDIVDHHSYPKPSFPFDQERFGEYIMVVGEFGGIGLEVPGHLWNPGAKNWGYGGLPKQQDEMEARYRECFKILADLKTKGVAGAIYTQTTDCEGELNGLLTYDRELSKIPVERLAKIHATLTE